MERLAQQSRFGRPLRVRSQPSQCLNCVLIRGKHWIPNVGDPAVSGDQRDALVEALAVDVEGRQTQRRPEGPVAVAEEGDGMCSRSANSCCAPSSACSDRARNEAVVVVTVRARLWGTAAGPGDRIPTIRHIDSRHPGPRVHVYDGPGRGDLRDVDPRPVRRPKRDVRQRSAGQVRTHRRPRDVAGSTGAPLGREGSPPDSPPTWAQHVADDATGVADDRDGVRGQVRPTRASRRRSPPSRPAGRSAQWGSAHRPGTRDGQRGSGGQAGRDLREPTRAVSRGGRWRLVRLR